MIHSPADIVRYLLIEGGHGSLPTDNDPWPVYVQSEPPDPGNCITVYGTDGLNQGRLQTTGEVVGPKGFQVRVRSDSYVTGWDKAETINQFLQRDVYNETITVGGETYYVQSITQIGNTIPIGKERDNARRDLFTINAYAYVRV